MGRVTFGLRAGGREARAADSVLEMIQGEAGLRLASDEQVRSSIAADVKGGDRGFGVQRELVVARPKPHVRRPLQLGRSRDHQCVVPVAAQDEYMLADQPGEGYRVLAGPGVDRQAAADAATDRGD